MRTPLVRREGELQPATWDEAFAAVADGLGRVWDDGDRDAVAIYLGNPTAHSVAGALFVGPLVKALGTRNVFSASTVDQMPKHASSGLLFGSAGAIPVPDLDRTDHLLMLGANPLESNGSLCTAPDFPGRLAAIRERGGRVVTVDPRRTKTAEASDEHIAIRPGTDALWTAALVTEIDRAGLVRPGRLAEHLDGLDDVLAALAPFDADSVAAHTRIDPDTTRRVARELADAPTAAVYGRIGTLMLTTGPYDDLDMATLLASPHGIDLGPLEPRLPEMLRTASGRIELASPTLLDDVSRLRALLDEDADDQLLLVGRRHLRSNNSWMHNIEVLVKGRPRCTLQLHPVDALERGVEHGDDVVVRSDAGEVTAVAEVTDTVSVGTVSLPHGWGHGVEGTRGEVAARTVGVNSNELTTDTAIDPLSGNARLNAIPVEVVRVAADHDADQPLPVAGG